MQNGLSALIFAFVLWGTCTHSTNGFLAKWNQTAIVRLRH